jgi:hypothetical protein
MSMSKQKKQTTASIIGVIALVTIGFLVGISARKAFKAFKASSTTSGKIENIKRIFLNDVNDTTVVYRQSNHFDAPVKTLRFKSERTIVFKEDVSFSEEPWAKYHGTIDSAGNITYTYVEIHIREYKEIEGKYSIFGKNKKLLEKE